MKDKNLYNEIKSFCKDGIKHIAKLLATPGDCVPKKNIDNFRIVDNNTISHKQSTAVDWGRLIINQEKELQKIASYKHAIKSLNNHSIIGKQLNTLIGTREHRRRLGDKELLRIFLTSLILESNKAVFDEQKFNTLYNKIEKFFYTNEFHFRYFAPISNFSMEPDKLELEDSLNIIKITKEEKEGLLSTSNAFYSMFPTLAYKECAFEFLIDQSKIVGENNNLPKENFPEITRSLFNKTCNALRLYKEGMIGFNHIWVENMDWGDFFGKSSYFSHTGPTDLFGDKMTIFEKEIPGFIDLWNKYQKIDSKDRKKIINSITRLGYGMERSRAEDRIVDYFIGLESLFLNDNNPELNFRLALYTAHWLGNNSDERKKIFQIITKGYEQRSKIVHGGSVKKDFKIDGQKVTIDKLAKDIEIYLREAAKKFVIECNNSGKGEEKLLKELNDKILE